MDFQISSSENVTNSTLNIKIENIEFGLPGYTLFKKLFENMAL